MRARTPKRAARDREANVWRKALCARVGRCEHCLKSKAPEYLDCDEIARGSGHRMKALDKAYAILVVCRQCHRVVQDWSRAKRLALLYLARPSDFDLEAFYVLTDRRWPEWHEVEVHVRELTQGR